MYLYGMKFRIPRKIKNKLKKFKWLKEVKPWSLQYIFDEYKSGNLEFKLWNSHSRYL